MNILKITTVIVLLLPFLSHAQSNSDHAAIQNVFNTLAEAWLEGNGEKFASVFADEHDYIVWNGFYFKDINRKMNARNHDGIFHSIYANTKLDYVIDQLRFVTDQVVLVHVLGAVSKKGTSRPENPAVLFTALLEKTNTKWEISSFHNLDLEIYEDEQTKANSPIPAHIMYASWFNAE